MQPEKSRRIGIAAALAGALVGAWLGDLATSGFTALLTTVVGATVGANALLLALDMLASVPELVRCFADHVNPVSRRS